GREAAEGEAAAVLAAADCRIGPGRVNAHTHLYSGLAPFGLPAPEPPPEDFVQILERLWWRLDRALDERALAAAARFYVAEALLAGTTALVDHHESPSCLEGSLDLLADICQELGIRALLCYGATERNGGRTEARRGLAECRRFLLSNRRPLVRGMIGLHASFTVSDETVSEAGELCRELGTVLHVHVAEDVADVEDARRRGWAGPLERLLDLRALPPGSILAHGVHLTADQVRLAADHGLWLVQNPRSNRGNRVGYPAALAASGRVALGTDGYPSRMEEEVAALRAEATAHGEQRDAVERRVSAGWSLIAERFGERFVPLEPGAAADAVALDSEGIRHLLVAGRPGVTDGRLLPGDLDAIRAEAAREAERLAARMRALP
ncbi:MAG TPA: amidohydrolase family protein, partial [Thermoanaerobaculia bacterium]|nr:amidohydrolase family protein [Thermoanaerobaculia bacterium]